MLKDLELLLIKIISGLRRHVRGRNRLRNKVPDLSRETRANSLLLNRSLIAFLPRLQQFWRRFWLFFSSNARREFGIYSGQGNCTAINLRPTKIEILGSTGRECREEKETFASYLAPLARSSTLWSGQSQGQPYAVRQGQGSD